MRALKPFMTGLRALLILFAMSHAAYAQSCRLALVLALDVSGSVDPQEYAQQVQGLAAALDHPEIRDQLLDSAGAPVSLAVFEWSSRNHQFIIQPWIVLDTCLLYTSPSPRDRTRSRMPSSA